APDTRPAPPAIERALPASPGKKDPMFTGIIEDLGTVETLALPAPDQDRPARLRIRSPHVLEDVALGDSISVSGCCLTVAEHDGRSWTADVIATTLAAT